MCGSSTTNHYLQEYLFELIESIIKEKQDPHNKNCMGA